MTQARNGAIAAFARIDIEGFCAGTWSRTLQPWREVLAGLIGAEIVYSLETRDFVPEDGRRELAALTGLQVLEARWGDSAPMPPVTEAMRRGLWLATPAEPLWVPLLMSLPGSDMPARHAAAIAVRLAELTPRLEALDPGEGQADVPGIHAAAQRFFTAQARSRRDVPVQAEYRSPAGDFLLSEVRLA